MGGLLSWTFELHYCALAFLKKKKKSQPFPGFWTLCLLFWQKRTDRIISRHTLSIGSARHCPEGLIYQFNLSDSPTRWAF